MAQTKKTVRVIAKVAKVTKRNSASKRNAADYVITPSGLGSSRVYKVWSKQHGDLGTYKTHAQAAKVVADRTKKNPSAFQKCVKAVSKRKGIKSPAGVCATAGRKKYGAKVFAAMGLAGRKKNPESIASVSYGSTFADISKKGDSFVADISRKGKKIASKVWKSLRQAMEWAEDQIFSAKNPVDQAEKMFEMFHGYPSKEVLEYVEKEHRHSVLAGLGTLTEIHVENVQGTKVAILNAPDPETANFADVIQVAVSEDGKQLYLVGGDQKIPFDTLKKQFGMTEADFRDKMLIGTITRITYRTIKSFEAKGQRQVDFYHDLGKEHAKGICPVMEYKPRNPSIEIVGGRYHIAPGEKFLKGVSPGIVG